MILISQGNIPPFRMNWHTGNSSLDPCRNRSSAESPNQLRMGRRAKLPGVPLEVWQRVASMMGARNWCRSAASTCRAFNNIAWPMLLIDCRIEKGGYRAQDSHEAWCRRNKRASSVDPLEDLVWGPDCCRIPEWGLRWALLHWQETVHFIFIYDKGESVSAFSCLYNNGMCLDRPAPAGRLLRLEVHFEPTNERAQEEFADDNSSEDATVALLVVCLAAMPNVKHIMLGWDAPEAFHYVAARLGVTVDECCDCAYWDTTFVCRPRLQT